jgi:hypothetical protein
MTTKNLLVAPILCKVTLLVTIAVVTGMVVQWRRQQPQLARAGPAAGKQRKQSSDPQSAGRARGGSKKIKRKKR